jgi:hypothetical protein
MAHERIMTQSNAVTVNFNPLKLLGTLALGWLLITSGVAGVLLGLSSALLGLKWFLSVGWVIAVVTGVLVASCCGTMVLIAIIRRRPRVEIGPDGFVLCHLFGNRSRSWSDIEGRFVVIKVGMSKGVGYRLTQVFKESAGIEPTTLFAGNDEAIGGALDMPIDELAELLNQRKAPAPGAV